MVCLCILVSLLGNNSVKTFPWQRRIVGGVVFYVVRVVSKESGRSVLPRTSCSTTFYFFLSHPHSGDNSLSSVKLQLLSVMSARYFLQTTAGRYPGCVKRESLRLWGCLIAPVKTDMGHMLLRFDWLLVSKSNGKCL
jgi:hypothetical protein